MSAVPTWYDLLDVEPSASTEEVRAAWRDAVADLDPTDRRFQRLSEAAAVLLDEDRRAEYDASLTPREATQDADTSAVGEPAVGEPAVGETPAGGSGADGHERGEVAVAPTRRPGLWRPAGQPPLGVLAAAAVLAVVLVATAAFAWSRPDPTSIEHDADAARSAAERAVVPVLSYDYRTLADGQKEAESWLTPTYRDKDYRPLFATIEENAPSTRTVVTTKVVSSAVVRADQDRVEVLVLVDRPTTNKQQSTPITYEDHVTVTMERSGDGWLVDDMST